MDKSTSVLEHARTVLFLVARLLKEHEVDEETRAHEHRLDIHIKIHGEADPEVVRVGEKFSR